MKQEASEPASPSTEKYSGVKNEHDNQVQLQSTSVFFFFSVSALSNTVSGE